MIFARGEEIKRNEKKMKKKGRPQTLNNLS
jgi:hypothetical protein